MIPITELNHAVLYVRDLDRMRRFYTDVLGFAVVAEMTGRAAFLRAAGSTNHHDLGLIVVGERAPSPAPGSTGLYHLAWRVPTIDDLADARTVLERADALAGQSDHGVSKSLYARDPEGNELELMFLLPADQWGDDADAAPVRPLDLDAEVARHGTR